jgi:hypothetical protein
VSLRPRAQPGPGRATVGPTGRAELTEPARPGSNRPGPARLTRPDRGPVCGERPRAVGAGPGGNPTASHEALPDSDRGGVRSGGAGCLGQTLFAHALQPAPQSEGGWEQTVDLPVEDALMPAAREGLGDKDGWLGKPRLRDMCGIVRRVKIHAQRAC